jgi:hypothetical protein
MLIRSFESKPIDTNNHKSKTPTEVYIEALHYHTSKVEAKPYTYLDDQFASSILAHQTTHNLLTREKNVDGNQNDVGRARLDGGE